MAEVSTNLGRVSIRPRGAYNESTIYGFLDLIEYEGSSFLVLKEGISGITPTVGVNYMLIAAHGVEGTPGAPGNDGVGIVSIVLTEGNHAPGTLDTYTITFTDESTQIFQVYNGRDGEGSGDMSIDVYDPQNKHQDIFKYVDDAVSTATPENAVTVTGGGTIQPPTGLGAGPYTFKMTQEAESGDVVNLVKAPIGTIVVWSGSADSIPAGWALCDGQDGRPDLRGKFVLGAGTEYAVGDTGGEEKHVLTVGEMPAHGHNARAVNAPGTVYDNLIQGLSSGGTILQSPVTIAGSSQPHNNMPPYYALCYIIKVTTDPADGVTQAELDTALAGKQDTITPGDGLSKEGNTLSVGNPVRGIMSQAEFDALTEAQKASGTYFVDDGQGGSCGEVYDGQERVIGTWFGKPLYQIGFSTTSITTPNEWTVCKANAVPNVEDVVSLSSIFKRLTGSVNATFAENVSVEIGPTGDYRMYLAANSTNMMNIPVNVTVQYTKTTDQEVSA